MWKNVFPLKELFLLFVYHHGREFTWSKASTLHVSFFVHKTVTFTDRELHRVFYHRLRKSRIFVASFKYMHKHIRLPVRVYFLLCFLLFRLPSYLPPSFFFSLSLH